MYDTLTVPEQRLVSYRKDDTVRWVSWPVRSSAVVISSYQQWDEWLAGSNRIREGAPADVLDKFQIEPPAEAGSYWIWDLVKQERRQQQLTANQPNLQGIVLFGPRVMFEPTVLKGRRRLG